MKDPKSIDELTDALIVKRNQLKRNRGRTETLQNELIRVNVALSRALGMVQVARGQLEIDHPAQLTLTDLDSHLRAMFPEL